MFRAESWRIGPKNLFLLRFPCTAQVLDISNSNIPIAGVLRSEHDLPLLESLCFGVDYRPDYERVPPAVFRPRLRSLNMFGIRGPVPDNMGCMINLTELVIKISELPTLPDSVGELRSLEELDLYECELETLPASVANLTGLRSLGLSFNKLQSCPPLGALQQLTALDLHYNFLTSLLEGIMDLPELKNVSIHGNCISTLEWAVVRWLPLPSGMPDTYDPSDEDLMADLWMRARNGEENGSEDPVIV